MRLQRAVLLAGLRSCTGFLYVTQNPANGAGAAATFGAAAKAGIDFRSRPQSAVLAFGKLAHGVIAENVAGADDHRADSLDEIVGRTVIRSRALGNLAEPALVMPWREGNILTASLIQMISAESKPKSNRYRTRIRSNNQRSIIGYDRRGLQSRTMFWKISKLNESLRNNSSLKWALIHRLNVSVRPIVSRSGGQRCDDFAECFDKGHVELLAH